MLIIFALLAVIAGVVLAIKNGEYRSGTFWLLCAIVLLLVLPQVLPLIVRSI